MNEREDTDHLNTFLSFNQRYEKAGFMRQVWILLKKNVKVTMLKWNFIIAHLLTLTLVCLVIMFINYLTRYSYENEPSRIYDVEPVGNIKKCDFDPSCRSFGYVIIGEQVPWVSYVLDDIVKKTGFDREKDIVMLYSGDNITQALTDVKKKNSFAFSTIVIFCSTNFTISNQTIPCDLAGTKTYWLLYNQTLVKQNFLDNMNAPLKLSMHALRAARMVENALSNYILREENGMTEVNIEHNYTAQDYPKVQSRMLIDFDTSSSQGSFWFFIPVMVSFLNFNTEIIAEKERKLRQGLMLFGVSSGAYWLAWILFIIIFDLLYALFITASGYLCGFSFFVNCPFVLLYAPFFCTLLSNHMMGLMLCTLVADNKSGSKYGYSIMLISIFYQIFFSNGLFLELIYTQEKPFGIVLLFYFMYINPSFHFANIFVNIISTAGNHFNNQTTMWNKGTQYSYSLFSKVIQGSLFGRQYVKPSPLQSLYGILINGGIYLVGLWLFDNLIASNRGFSRNPLLDLFVCKKKSKEDLVQLVAVQQQNGPMDHKPADIRKQIVVEDEKCINGIVMRDLWKSYKMSCSRGKDPRSDWALREINLQIKQGELLALLGPNGAGKTTMIGIIAGILNPTTGKFFSNGLDSETNQEEIRKVTNVCPQFDILWDELTAEEHIRMVGQIKGVSEADIQELAKAVLAIVNLESSLKEKIGNLSGGMKRRISIALATIGNPAILIFDEPTTGLDPENRRIIWKFINKLKENKRTILLTTHLLEEADILSDRISIMTRGQIKEIGTSSELKRRLGSGFKLNVVVKEASEDDQRVVEENVSAKIPQAKLLDNSAGSLFYSIPFKFTEEITKFLSDYEDNVDDIKSHIEDLTISNSTLEEVFMNVTNEDGVDDHEAQRQEQQQAQESPIDE